MVLVAVPAGRVRIAEVRTVLLVPVPVALLLVVPGRGAIAAVLRGGIIDPEQGVSGVPVFKVLLCNGHEVVDCALGSGFVTDAHGCVDDRGGLAIHLGDGAHQICVVVERRVRHVRVELDDVVQGAELARGKQWGTHLAVHAWSPARRPGWPWGSQTGQ